MYYGLCTSACVTKHLLHIMWKEGQVFRHMLSTIILVVVVGGTDDDVMEQGTVYL